MYECHFSGRSSRAKIAETGQTGTHAPQSMHSTGSMKSWSTCSKPGRPSSYCVSFFGWIQSTGQASTQAVSFVPIQGSAIMYGTFHLSFPQYFPPWSHPLPTYTASVEVPPLAFADPRFRLHGYSSPAQNPVSIPAHPLDRH